MSNRDTGRDFTIIGTTDPAGGMVGGGHLLLGFDPDDEMTPACIFNCDPPGNLGPVAPAAQHREFAAFYDYTGPQDVLNGVIPDHIFDASRNLMPWDREWWNEPDYDTMRKWQRGIAMGEPKPEGPNEAHRGPRIWVAE